MPGATFTCAVDGKAAKPCSSPFKRRYQLGKHVVVVAAVSTVGIVDPSPAKVKFRIADRKSEHPGPPGARPGRPHWLRANDVLPSPSPVC